MFRSLLVVESGMGDGKSRLLQELVKSSIFILHIIK